MIRVERLERARREFAETIRAMSALRSTRLVDALARVPREDFLGPGPWQMLRVAEVERGYELTPDDDPRHLYDNVLVALDASRNLNNGEPAFLLRCLDDLDLSPRDRFLHVGCGVESCTAVAAAAVAEGTVVASSATLGWRSAPAGTSDGGRALRSRKRRQRRPSATSGAGTETAHDHPCYLDGAIEAGLRAAGEIGAVTREKDGRDARSRT